ncbi:MAG: ABC transporter permease, partial [Candidatus Hodarchaeota archaeon]
MEQDIRDRINTRLTQLKLMLVMALRNAIRIKYRSLLLIIGVLFTIALETGIVVSVDTLYDDFILDHRNQNYSDITVSPKEWIGLTPLETLAREIQDISGVVQASPVYYTPVNHFLDIQVDINVLLYGIDSKTHPDFPHINVIAGIREISDQSILISESIQEIIGVEAGTTIPLASFDFLNRSDDREVTIAGIMSDDPYIGNKLFHAFILVDIEVLVEIISPELRPSLLTGEITVSVANLVDIHQTAENIKDQVGLKNSVFVEKSISQLEASGIRSYQTAMNLVILSSFFVEFLFIINILTIAMKDRQNEFGILRAVGTNSFQLIIVITIEILIYSLIGGVLGIFFGIGFATFLVRQLSLFYPSLKFQTLSIHVASLLATFVAGIVVALIAGLYPIFLGVSLPVVQNIHTRMRTVKSSYIFSNWRYAVVAGILLAATGFFLHLFVGPTRFLDFSILSAHFIVIMLIFLGTLLIEIGILAFLPKIGMRILFWIGIVTRTISMRNIAREFQKSLITIMTSALALTFIIVVGLTSAALITGVPEFYQNQWGVVDLVAEVRDTANFTTNFTRQLDNRTDIINSSFIQETRTEIGGIDAYVFGVNPQSYSVFAEPVMEAISDHPSSFFLNKTLGNTTEDTGQTKNLTYGVVSSLLYQRLHPHTPLGSTVRVKIGETDMVNITLAAIIKGNVFLGNGEYLYIASNHFQQFFNNDRVKWFVCDVNGSVHQTQKALELEYPDFKEVIGITYFAEKIERSLMYQALLFQVLFIESFILAAIAQFICILVSTLRIEREMGIMRSLGLSKRGVFGIFLVESVTLGFSALLVGLVDGILGTVLLRWYISLSIPIEFKLPLDRILLWLILSFVITLASTILPSFRSSQKNIVATIAGRPLRKSYLEQPAAFYSLDEQVPPSPLQQSKLAVESIDFPTSTTVGQFLRDHNVPVLTVFLLLLVFVTLNYIFDVHIIIRGLNPADIIWRLNGLLANRILFFDEESTFFFINPLLLVVGLAAIGPISHYLTHGVLPHNPVRAVTRSMVFGVLGLLVCSVVIFVLYLTFILVLLLLLEEAYYSAYFISNVMFLTITILFQLFCFQRVWAFLIFQGANPNLSFKQRLSLTRKIASKGQLGFILLLLLH